MALMPDFRVEIKGIDKLSATLSHLPNRMQVKVLKQAGQKAMRPVMLDTKRNARKQKRSGLLAKSIGTKVKVYKTTGTMIAMVGPRKGVKDEANEHWPVKIAHLVEHGTDPHEVSPKNKSILAAINDPFFKAGPAPLLDPFFSADPVTVEAEAKPFIGPAFQKNKSLAQDLFAVNIEIGLHKVAADLASKGGSV